MALKRLIAEEMTEISRGWIEPNSPARKEIEACSDTATKLSRIERVHDDLVAVTQPEKSDPRLEEISAEEVERDARHDDVIRGSHMLLTGVAYLLGMAGDGASILALRDKLIPDGLESVNKTYRGQSGQAVQLAERRPSIAADLADIQVGPKGAGLTLATFVEEWIQIGKRLGELEDEKGRIQSAPVDATGTERVKARNAWVRTANALLANAMDAELDDKKMAVIFGPMWAAEAVADWRGSTSSTKKPASGSGPVGGTPV